MYLLFKNLTGYHIKNFKIINYCQNLLMEGKEKNSWYPDDCKRSGESD